MTVLVGQNQALQCLQMTQNVFVNLPQYINFFFYLTEFSTARMMRSVKHSRKLGKATALLLSQKCFKFT